MKLRTRGLRLAGAAFLLAFAAASADAGIVLSDLIVELQPGEQAKDDIEVWNNSPDRAYVAVEPREIIDPGTSGQTVRKDPDPQKLGLLATPARMVLDPGQRKLIRVALLAPPANRERVFRVTVKPVVGELESHDSGLKILVGYDVLVLVRPQNSAPSVTAVRLGRELRFTNNGNVSVELVDGRQCDETRTHCQDLPGKRIYAGATWTEQLNSDLPVEYTVKEPGQVVRRTF
ncbi:MAG: molecular chaperone [Bacillota bacterium]